MVKISIKGWKKGAPLKREDRASPVERRAGKSDGGGIRGCRFAKEDHTHINLKQECERKNTEIRLDRPATTATSKKEKGKPRKLGCRTRSGLGLITRDAEEGG